MNTRSTLAVMLWCTCVSPSSAQLVREAKVPRQVIQCGAFAAEFNSREGEAGVWAVTQGALRVHTSAPSSSADSPFTTDCRRAVLVEPAGQLAVYELPERQTRWPAPSLLIDLPKEKGRVCEVALLRWQNPKRLSLIVGCELEEFKPFEWKR